jgi:hypothetical protein
MLTFRNSKIVYYGPHPCEGCGAMIVKMGVEWGGTAFNAPDTYAYPNTEWHPHVCDPVDVGKLRTDADKRGLEASYATLLQAPYVAVDGSITVGYIGAPSASVAPVGINADGTMCVNYTGVVNAISGQPQHRGVR